MLTNKLQYKKFYIRNTLLSVLLITLASIMLINFPHVSAFTNQFSCIGSIGGSSCGGANGSTGCYSCSNPETVTGTIANQNDLLVIVSNCYTSGTISTITDSKGINAWTKAISQSLTTPASALGSASTAVSEIWFESSTTNTGSITVTITWTISQTGCAVMLLEGNTPYTALYSAQGSIGTTPATNGATFGLTTQYNSIPANSIVLTTNVLYFITDNTVVCINSLYNSPVLPLQPMTQLCGGSPAAFYIDDNGGNIASLVSLAQSYIQSQTPFPITYTYTVQTTTPKTASAATQQLVAIFSSTGTVAAPGPSTFTAGCPSTGVGTKSVTLPSNATYFVPLSTTLGLPANTFITISNISLWIKSISLTNAQTKASLYVGLYAQNIYSPNNINPTLPSATNIWSLVQYFPNPSTFINSASPIHVSIGGQTNLGGTNGVVNNIIINVAAGQMYALGVYATHDGFTLGSCNSSMSIYYQNQLNTNNPNTIQVRNGQLSSATPVGVGHIENISLYATGTTPGIITIQTQTTTNIVVTSYSTVTSISTTGIATVTITQNSTIITNVLASSLGGATIVTNLITYFPIWLLPLVFGFMGGMFGFGLGGLLYGLLIALIIGQLSLGFPLWTVFLDVVMLYLILRR